MANQPLTNTISENYKMLTVLGQGCYGHVIKCFKRDTKETVAVKVLKQRHSQFSHIREVSYFLMITSQRSIFFIAGVIINMRYHIDCGWLFQTCPQVFILEKLRCLDPDKSNIVRCHKWFHRINQTFVVFEMLDMSLHDYISQTNWSPLPLNGIRTIIKDVRIQYQVESHFSTLAHPSYCDWLYLQVATALNALNGIGLIHTDLKLDNIMLVDHQRQPFRVKLIDFGSALQISEARPGLGVQHLWYRWDLQTFLLELPEFRFPVS